MCMCCRYRPSDKLHLVHVLPQSPTLHSWPGVYVPPDEDNEREEVSLPVDANMWVWLLTQLCVCGGGGVKVLGVPTLGVVHVTCGALPT
jgi:hypothetical protein